MMKHFYLLCSLLLSTIILCSCSKDSEPDNPTTKPPVENSDPDSYYVRYEITMGTAFTADGSVSTDNGRQSFYLNNRESYNETFGPVKKGFNADISIAFYHKKAGTNNYTLKIYVSKNQEPFSLKASDSGEISNMSNTRVLIYRVGY